MLDYSKDCKLKRCITTVRNVDNLFCARALAVGIAMAQGHSKLKQIKLGKNIQKELAIELCRNANVLFGPCGLGEISRLQSILGEYQIIVIDFHARNCVIYEGPSRGRKIVLYKNGDHYVVNPDKMPAFFAKRFYCDKCKTFYNDYFHHPCNDPCNTCLHKTCSGIEGEGRECPVEVAILSWDEGLLRILFKLVNCKIRTPH